MANNLVIIHDEVTKWGATPYENMVAAAKAREARKNEIALELTRAEQKEIRRQNAILYLREVQARQAIRDAEKLAIKIEHQEPHPAPKIPPYSLSRKIVRRIEEIHNLPPDQIFKHIRTMKIVLPRQIAIYEIHMHFNWSLQKIGMFFAGRDHTTILHALRKIGQMKREDQAFAAKLDEIDAEVREIIKLNRQSVVDKGAAIAPPPSIDERV